MSAAAATKTIRLHFGLVLSASRRAALDASFRAALLSLQNFNGLIKITYRCEKDVYAKRVNVSSATTI